MNDEWKARAEAAEAELARLQNEIWSSFGKWSQQLGWGLTGIQPECYALMDAAVSDLARLREPTGDVGEVSDAAFSAGVYAVADVLCASQYVNAPDASFVLTLAHHAFAAGIAAQAATPTEAK